MRYYILAAAMTWTTHLGAQELCSQHGEARAAYDAFLADAASGRRKLPERFVFPEYEKISFRRLDGCAYALSGVIESSNAKALNLRFQIKAEFDKVTQRWLYGELMLSAAK